MPRTWSKHACWLSSPWTLSGSIGCSQGWWEAWFCQAAFLTKRLASEWGTRSGVKVQPACLSRASSKQSIQHSPWSCGKLAQEDQAKVGGQHVLWKKPRIHEAGYQAWCYGARMKTFMLQARKQPAWPHQSLLCGWQRNTVRQTAPLGLKQADWQAFLLGNLTWLTCRLG